mgnify:CR=1 FL=1
MSRANRYFLRDHVWHITHRCHKKEFLLKFAKDRGFWRHKSVIEGLDVFVLKEQPMAYPDDFAPEM